MIVFVIGLVLFLGLHSIRIFAEGTRTALVERLGDKGYKGAYSVVSLVGFVLLVWGYAQARQWPTVLWPRLPGMDHVAALLMLAAFVLLAAAYVPGNAIKAKLGHPILLATKVWALAHLLANNTLADLLLFGGFLVWAVPCFRAARRRDRTAGVTYPPGRTGPTVVTVIVGVLAAIVFAHWLHAPLIGVRPY